MGRNITIKIGTPVGGGAVVVGYSRDRGYVRYTCRCRCGRLYDISAFDVSNKSRPECPQCGLERRIRKTTNHDNINAAIRMRKTGSTYQQIGDTLGVSRERVRQILKRSGNLELLSPVTQERRQRLFESRRRAVGDLTHLPNEEIARITKIPLYIVSRVAPKLRGISLAQLRINQRIGTKAGGMEIVAHVSGRNYRFLCHCGKDFVANLENVRSGKTKSCGCRHQAYLDAKRLGLKYDKESGKIVANAELKNE